MNIDALVSNMNEIIHHTIFGKELGPRGFKNKNLWRSLLKHKAATDEPVLVSLKPECAYYFYNFMDDVRRYCKEKNLNFSAKYLDDRLMDLIGQFQNVDITKDTQRLVSDFLKSFDNLDYKTFQFFLPINHYDYREETSLEGFKIKKLTLNEYLEYMPSRRDDKTNKMFYDDLINSNNTDTIAIIEIDSINEDDAEQKAREKLQKFIHSEKLFDPFSFITNRYESYVLISECIIVVNKTDSRINCPNHNHFIPTRTTPSKKFYDELKPYRDKFYKFLFNDNLTSLQEAIISALYWYGEATNLRDSNTKKYISYITSLEKITMKKCEQSKKKKFAECIATFRKTPDQISFYRDYYERRNKLIHDEAIRIYDEQVFTLLDTIRTILFEMIDNCDKFNTVEEFWLTKYDYKLS